MAVGRQVRGREQPVRRDERVQLAQPVEVDDLDRDADELAHRRPRTELVEPVLARREPDAAALVVVALEPAVELDRVAEQAHHVVARVELRAEPGRVPGRAARQLGLLEQHDVVPAELREVVREAAARDSASDDCDPRVLSHCGIILYTRPTRRAR